MNKDEASWKLFMLIALVTGCFIVSSLLAMGYILAITGEIPTNMEAAIEKMSLAQVRIFIGINQFFSFLLPGLIGLYFIKFKKRSYLHPIPFWHYFLFILWYFASLPFFQWLYYINYNLQVPSWWPFQVEAVPEFLVALISDPSPIGLLTNLLVIALLPALGEELIFRVLGIRLIERISGNGHWAVWVTAFLFAIIHFDFQGLMPRFFLGLLLGYGFLLSRNFLVPFIIHFIHNGSQLLIAYFSPSTVESLNQNIEAPHIAWVIISGLAIAGGYLIISKLKSVE